MHIDTFRLAIQVRYMIRKSNWLLGRRCMEYRTMSYQVFRPDEI